LDFSIASGSFEIQVHRRAAESAEGDSFVLSGERPESTKARAQNYLIFVVADPFPLPASHRQGKNCTSPRPQRLRGENLFWTRMIISIEKYFIIFVIERKNSFEIMIYEFAF